MISKVEYIDSWNKLHGNPQNSKIIKGWLNFTYQITNSLIRKNNHNSNLPNIITSVSILISLLYFLFVPGKFAFLLIILALLLDGFDGPVAIITSSTSKWGAVFDSVADRISESFWLLGIYRALKLPGWCEILIFLLWSGGLIQEYLRARFNALFIEKKQTPTTEVTSINERPVRAIFLIFIAILQMKFWPISAIILVIAFLFQLIAIIQIGRDSYQRLST